MKRTCLVDARTAGEGNLEIFVQVGEQSLPTDVQPLGNAIFGVSFETFDSSLSYSEDTPLKQTTYSTEEELSSDARRQQPHIIYITFNDDNVPGNNNHNSF